MAEKIRHMVLIRYNSGKKAELWFDNLLDAKKTADKINSSDMGRAEIIARG